MRIITKNPYIITDPRVVRAVAKYFLKKGAREVLIGEKPGCGITSSSVFENPIIRNILQGLPNARFVAFDTDELIKVSIDGYVLNELHIPQSLLNADVVVDLPKMKTHIQAQVSLGIKNWQGITVDEERYFFHRNDLHLRLVDILKVRPPDYCVIDAIWPIEGQAPLYGTPVKGFNTIIAGDDVVAADSVAAYLMGFDTDEIPAINLAYQQGIGEKHLDKIDIQGENVETLRRSFKRPKLSLMGVYPNINVIEGGACSGCLSSIRHSIDRLEFEGIREKLPPITIYTGKPMPETKSLHKIIGKFYTFGNCAAYLSQNYTLRKKIAENIPGCPPYIIALYDSIKGDFNEP